MSTTSTKRNIVFATIPRDYVVLNPEERETKCGQFIELLHLEDFPIHRLYLFINPTGRMLSGLFYAELKKAQRGIRITFVPVKAENDFTVRDIRSSYRFFSGFFSRFTFDTGAFDYYMYFSSATCSPMRSCSFCSSICTACPCASCICAGNGMRAEETGLRKYMKARSAGGFQKSDNTNGIAAMRWIFSSLRLKRAMRHSTP